MLAGKSVVCRSYRHSTLTRVYAGLQLLYWQNSFFLNLMFNGLPCLLPLDSAKMLQSISPSHDWFCESEPLLFDEEFCQSFMQSIPTPPQSPPLKTDISKALSKVDQLELVSELLLEDQDFLKLNWNCDFMHESTINKDHQTDVTDDCLWHIGEKALDKLSVLSTSPLLSDIDTSIFEEIAGSTLVCHDAALENKSSEEDDFLLDSQEQNESSSDYGSLSAGGESSTSDSGKFNFF